MKWTIEELKKQALKYKNRTDFKNGCSGYQSALRKGILDEICSHMEEIRHKWTNEELFKIGSKYKSRSEFELKNPKAYSSSLKRGLMDMICVNMRPPLTKPYTLEEIQLEANKYKTRGEFAKNGGGAYNAAKKRDDFELIVAHMNPIPKNWSLDDLIEEAAKYKTKGEFYRKNKNVYQIAVKRSDYDLICSHMSDVYVSWTFHTIQKEALKYKTITEFQRGSKGAYSSAYRKKILGQICHHMKPPSGPSIPETKLFDLIKSIYPKTQKLKELKIKMVDRPYVNSFEIDIYIPELRKGIEFDGKYHHSFDGLKRGHPSWPDEGIRLYHQLKDAWFLSKGIQLLHIKEKDWDLDRETCIKKCLEFLKQN